MKRSSFLLMICCCLAAVLGIASCRQQAASSNRQEVSAADAATVDSLVAGIDSLKTLAEALKPGLGEFMLQLKYHHDRLGEAITAKDYERAQYEIDEMKETAEKIIHLNITNDKLTQPFAGFYEKYLQSPLQVLADVAAKKDGAALRVNFISLTGNCNSCHRENNMSFMKIGSK